MQVSPERESQLQQRMKRLGIHESDLVETFIRGSGKGGQKINKTSSCVRLVHPESSIEIKCQQERSQAMNRHLARRELCDRLEERQLGDQSRRQQEAARIRRQKRRRSRRSKSRMIADRARQSQKKQLRQKPGME